jgi:hypothetical protein
MKLADKANQSAVQALKTLSDEYSTLDCKAIAKALVSGGASWSENTIRLELGRLRRVSASGKDVTGMNSNELRLADKALPKAERTPKTPTATADAVEVKATPTAKLARQAPDTLARALVESVQASGVEDLEAVLAECRRLIVAEVNAKKKAK